MKYKILGEFPLSGTVQISGARNSALKILAGAIVSDGFLELFNIPRVGDVFLFIELLKSLGVSAEFKSNGCLEINSSGLNSFELPAFSKNIKSSILFVGPLLARFGKAILPQNSKYSFDMNFKVLKSLGVSIAEKGSVFEFECSSLRAAEINFLSSTHTGTDNAILSSVLAEGSSVITNAAAEPEVDDLISALNKMGAKIKRADQNPRTILVEGVRNLGKLEHTIIPDRNEPVFYASCALFTNGSIVIKNLNTNHLTSFISKLSFMGANYEIISPSEMRIWADPENLFKPSNIEVKPYPGFMADWQPFISVLLTKAAGESVVTDMVLNRFEFAKELNRIGAKIEFLDSGIKVFGPTKLKGVITEAEEAISVAALVVAGLGAKGKTEIRNAEIINSELENTKEKLQNLGAVIKEKA